MAKIRDDFALLRDRIIITVLFAYGVSLLFFFVYSIFTFPEKLFLWPFRLRWTLIQTFVYFISTLNPIQCTAILLACSFTAPPVPSLKTKTEDAFSRLISTTLTVLILFSAVFIGLSEGWLPNLMRDLKQLEHQTLIARNYLKLAGSARSDGNLNQSAAYLSFYLSVDPGTQDAVDMLSDVRGRMGNTDGTEDRRGPTLKARMIDLDPPELIERARSALALEDYYTAFYFVDLAKKLSPPQSTDYRDADRIAGTIQKRLSSYQADSAELESKALFEMKTRGFNDLASDDVRLVSRAYYTFLMLAHSHPDDPEARNYLNQSIAKLKTLGFFIDEIDDLIAMPGLADLFFVNSRADDESVQLVAIGRVINTENGMFAEDIEAVTFGHDGSIRCRVSAQTGKIMKDPHGRLAIYMRGIDPASNAGTRLPVYADRIDETACGEILYLSPTTIELELLSRTGRDLDSYRLTELWGMWETVSPFGYPPDVIQLAVISRIVSAFGVLVLSLIALAVGWRLRSPHGRPSIGAMLLIPTFPFIAHFIIHTYEYVHLLMVGTALANWGLSYALLILFAIEFILLAISILALATQAIKFRELK